VALVYLVGFMGSGKTSVGRRLAAALGVRFVDLDGWIEEEAGMTVAEIFARRGEAEFRREETRLLAATAALGSAVVATGGGTYCSPANRRIIAAGGGVAVFLDVPWEEIERRLPGKNLDRPRFRDRESARRLYEARRPDYLRADVVIPLSGDETPEEVARRVLERIGERACAT